MSSWCRIGLSVRRIEAIKMPLCYEGVRGICMLWRCLTPTPGGVVVPSPPLRSLSYVSLDRLPTSKSQATDWTNPVDFFSKQSRVCGKTRPCWFGLVWYHVENTTLQQGMIVFDSRFLFGLVLSHPVGARCVSSAIMLRLFLVSPLAVVLDAGLSRVWLKYCSSLSGFSMSVRQ